MTIPEVKILNFIEQDITLVSVILDYPNTFSRNKSEITFVYKKTINNANIILNLVYIK